MMLLKPNQLSVQMLRDVLDQEQTKWGDISRMPDWERKIYDEVTVELKHREGPALERYR